MRPWLLAEGSLTRHLIAASAGAFRVERLHQSWQHPTLSEARLLGSDPSRYALIREVILWGRNEPWVYARSVMPQESLNGDLRRLRRLQNASLGALLFDYPQLRRTPFELACFEPARSDCALPLEQSGEQPLWGRRSRFAIDARMLIVGEIFLDAFVRSPALLHPPASQRR